MKRLLCLTFLWSGLLAGCGGSGGGDAAPASNPPAAIPPVVFKAIPGSTPADAALGQPLTVEWVLPAGVDIQSVVLDAVMQAGPVTAPTSCTASAGTLPSNATAATITLPNTCDSKTVKEVNLRVTVRSTTGQSTSATHSFLAPGAPTSFVPQRVNLPVLRILTDNVAPIVSREVYLSAQMNLESNVVGEAPVIGGLQIRGRGNSTWGMPKKPYRLKLTDKHSLLGMPSSRDWVLLANYSDKSLLRNSLALRLGTNIGMAWTPRSAFVELHVNNRYEGVYLLVENIKVAKDRVDIDELDEDDVGAEEVTGGYLLEVDFRRDGHTIQTAIDRLPVVFQDPEEPVPAQENYIKAYLDQFESVLHSSDFADPVTGYAAYIDVDSFIRWYLVNEVFRNRDANLWSSCWMYKPRGGKLHMGPLWDFDIAAGNINYDDGFQASGWWVREGPWFSRLFEDPIFVARVRQVWSEIMTTQLPAMLQSIPANAAALQQSQLNNFQRWPILETYVWPNFTIPGSYSGEVGYLQSFLSSRIAWMNGQLSP